MNALDLFRYNEDDVVATLESWDRLVAKTRDAYPGTKKFSPLATQQASTVLSASTQRTEEYDIPRETSSFPRC